MSNDRDLTAKEKVCLALAFIVGAFFLSWAGWLALKLVSGPPMPQGVLLERAADGMYREANLRATELCRQ
jgi:hypothetical protein